MQSNIEKQFQRDENGGLTFNAIASLINEIFNEQFKELGLEDLNLGTPNKAAMQTLLDCDAKGILDKFFTQNTNVLGAYFSLEQLELDKDSIYDFITDYAEKKNPKTRKKSSVPTKLLPEKDRQIELGLRKESGGLTLYGKICAIHQILGPFNEKEPGDFKNMRLQAPDRIALTSKHGIITHKELTVNINKHRKESPTSPIFAYWTGGDTKKLSQFISYKPQPLSNIDTLAEKRPNPYEEETFPEQNKSIKSDQGSNHSPIVLSSPETREANIEEKNSKVYSPRLFNNNFSMNKKEHIDTDSTFHKALETFCADTFSSNKNLQTISEKIESQECKDYFSLLEEIEETRNGLTLG